MPQNPIPSTLLVTRVKAGANITVSPSSGTGIVTVSAPEANYNPAAVAITGGVIDGTALGDTTPAAVHATTLSATGLATLAGIGSSVPQQAYNTNTNASGTVTLTAAQCTGGSEEVWVNCTGTQAGAFAIDLPTVAALVTAMQGAGLNPIAGGTYVLNVMNNSASTEVGTITTASGWTLNGTMTVAFQTYRKLLVTFTSLTAFAAQSLGEYAITGAV